MDEGLEFQRALGPPEMTLASHFDLGSKSLMPLVGIKSTAAHVVLTFDIPYAEKKGIRVTATTATVEIDARLREPTNVRVGWTVQKHIRFHRYKASVKLPRAVKPEAAKATFKNGLLTVTMPLAGPGRRVKVR